MEVVYQTEIEFLEENFRVVDKVDYFKAQEEDSDLLILVKNIQNIFKSQIVNKRLATHMLQTFSDLYKIEFGEKPFPSSFIYWKYFKKRRILQKIIRGTFKPIV